MTYSALPSISPASTRVSVAFTPRKGEDRRRSVNVELVVTSDFARRRFLDVVAPHLDDAYGLARWLTGSGTDAEDVVQEACLRALASLEAATIEQPRAWLLTIVRNSAFTWLAKNRPRSVMLTDDAQFLETAAARAPMQAPDAEAALIAKADEAALEAAIAALPHAFREVVVMRDINGLSYREIAAAIGVPVGTVMSRLARGRTLLIEKLGARR
jgi:RNA polymerase sigma factor (sigma-70 family)